MKIIKVKSCDWCPYLLYRSLKESWWCHKKEQGLTSYIVENHEIPDWCPLEGFETNQNKYEIKTNEKITEELKEEK